MRALVASLIIGSVLSGTVNAQDDSICLTKPEMRALVTLIVDRGTERLVDHCGTAMPKAAPFLAQNGPAVKARFDSLKGKSTATLLAKIFPFLPSDAMPLDNVVSAVIDNIIERSFDTKMTEKSCNQADIMTESLAALPDENLISAVTVMMERVLNAHNDQLPFRLCILEETP